MARVATWIVISIVAAGLGLAAFCLPVMVLNLPLVQGESQFPIVQTGMKHMSWLTLTSLFAIGIALGLASAALPKPRGAAPLVFGLMTMATFPITAFVDIAANPYSHNLWPIEFLFYAGIGMVAVAGAYLGFAGATLIRRRGTEDARPPV